MLTASKSLENLEAEGGLSEGEEEEGEEAKRSERSENGCSVDGGESGGGDDDSTTSRALKPWSVCFLCSLPVLLVVMCAWYWQFALVATMLFVPSARLFVWWRRNGAYAGPLDHMISSYAQGFYIIFAIANVSAFVAFVLTNAVLSFALDLLTGGEFSGRGALGWLVEGASWSAWVVCEEAWKVAFAAHAKQRRAHVIGEHNRNTKAWVLASTATAFGYATSQSILFCFLFTTLVSADGRVSLIELGWLVLYGLLFGAISQPLSILTSYLAGLELTRETAPAAALAWPALLRVAYVFQFFFWIACLGEASNWIALVLICVSVVAVYALAVRRVRHVQRALPFQLMEETQHLREVFGFRALNMTDDDDDDQARAARHPRTATCELVTSTISPLPAEAGKVSVTDDDIVEL